MIKSWNFFFNLHFLGKLFTCLHGFNQSILTQKCYMMNNEYFQILILGNWKEPKIVYACSYSDADSLCNSTGLTANLWMIAFNALNSEWMPQIDFFQFKVKDYKYLIQFRITIFSLFFYVWKTKYHWFFLIKARISYNFV